MSVPSFWPLMIIDRILLAVSNSSIPGIFCNMVWHNRTKHNAMLY